MNNWRVTGMKSCQAQTKKMSRKLKKNDQGVRSDQHGPKYLISFFFFFFELDNPNSFRNRSWIASWTFLFFFFFIIVVVIVSIIVIIIIIIIIIVVEYKILNNFFYFSVSSLILNSSTNFCFHAQASHHKPPKPLGSSSGQGQPSSWPPGSLSEPNSFESDTCYIKFTRFQAPPVSPRSPTPQIPRARVLDNSLPAADTWHFQSGPLTSTRFPSPLHPL